MSIITVDAPAPRGRISSRARGQGYITSYEAASIVDVPYRELKEWLREDLVAGAERTGPRGVWRIRSEALTCGVIEELRARHRRRLAGLGSPGAQRVLPVGAPKAPASQARQTAAILDDKLEPLNERFDRIEGLLRQHEHVPVTAAELARAERERRVYDTPSVFEVNKVTGLPVPPVTPAQMAAAEAEVLEARARGDIRSVEELELSEKLPADPGPRQVPAWTLAIAALLAVLATIATMKGLV